ncbi:crotonase/enoyl-CoA hydratase family protein [Pseudonocardia pini]|uniref:crotonase/enoyl-CoA hydratase family protein n=1 Tax=Pseudonocardia pini TaxID=2758030 RepID=UPI0015EFF6D6|nr:crotonase/enoyl-CoA hydratase family protein [Pseudonocardia pini]
MTAPVLVERQGHVLVVTLNRPEVRNALNDAVAHAVAAAMDELDADPELRVGVLTGAGGTFCAGMDLAAYQAGEWPVVGDRGLCGISRRPPRAPLVAAVEGWAVAGGFELLLACDLVVAGSGARLGVPEVQHSLVAGGGGALLLPRRLTLPVAMELLLTGDPVDAARAREIGLVNRVVPDGEALAEALRLAERIARNGPLGVAATKAIARNSAEGTYTDGWTEQDAEWKAVFASADAAEGVAAFLERRDPVWHNR